MELGVWREAPELEEVEAFDLLGLVVLEHLEVVGPEPLDDPPLLHGIGVHADEVRAPAEDRPLLRLGRPSTLLGATLRLSKGRRLSGLLPRLPGKRHEREEQWQDQ